MAPILYMHPVSAAVRCVQITAKALGVELHEKLVDLFKREQLTPEYLKLNPQHTVPTLVEENGFVVFDSHAISSYLVSKYGKSDALYPKDVEKRAVVDQRLHFDSGVAFAILIQVVRPMHMEGKTKIDDSDKESINKVYGILEAFLDGKKWIAGDSLTIADYSLYSTVSCLEICEKIDGKKFPKLAIWVRQVEALPEVQVGKKGLDDYAILINSYLS